MNRLEQESSPYLRQHADNPVDWYPWGPEALELAKKLDKPILLSVGYSACHWCHVMAHESFEDEACARLMNERFINVKVDREERPDLDQIYQGVVQLLGRGGGWPLTVFLTPDLRPFYGGTYFPPEDRYGMPSFQKVLHALSDAYQNQRGEIESQAEQFKAGLGELAVHGLGTGAEAIKPEDVARAGVLLATEVDRVNGGFGSAPKFPSPMSVALLLRAARREPSSPAREAALLTLRKMANGGVYDQLGGGFHRYSVDAKWLVPHFEKMLYDNAQLLHLYAEAYQCEPDPLFARVVEETVVYLQREMTSPQGGFFATQDADSEGEEGKFFVWGRDEALALLTPEEGEAFAQRYSLTASGNFEHGGRNVLEVVDASVDANDARLVSARQKLFAARALRVAPGRDDKVLTGWNGLMIRGLAFASRVFARPEWAALAARAADFLLATAWKDGRLTRVFQEGRTKIAGFVEDYGDLALGLTDLYQATFEPRYLAAAREVAAAAQALFWDEERKAYRSAPKGQADLVAEVYALHDNAVPSGASTLTHAQVTLSALLADAPLLEHARVYLERLKKDMGRNPFAYGHLWLAADALVDGAAELTVVGSRAETAPFVARVNRTYAPTLAVLAVDPDGAVHPVLAEAVKERTRVKGKAAAYLCRHFACELPVTEVDALRW